MADVQPVLYPYPHHPYDLSEGNYTRRPPAEVSAPDQFRCDATEDGTATSAGGDAPDYTEGWSSEAARAPASAGSTSPSLMHGCLRKAIPVEDWLLDMGQGYEEHKNRLRAERLKEELLSMNDRPAITERARTLTRGGVPVEDRLFNEFYKREERRKSSARVEKVLDDECTHQPSINPASRAVHSRWSNSHWEEKKAEHINQLRAQQEMEEMEAVRPPQIDEKSRKLAANRTKGMALEDYLMLSERQKQAQMYQKHEDTVAKEVKGHPRITAKALQLKREGDVSVRLYEQRLGGSLDTIITSRLDGTKDAKATSPKGMWAALKHRGEEESFKPRINPPPEYLRRSRGDEQDEDGTRPIEEKLLERHRSVERKKEDARDRKSKLLQSQINQCHTNRVSQALCKKKGLDRTAKKRLYGPRQKESPERSPQKQTCSSDFMARLSEWEALKHRKACKQEKMRAEQMKKELAECTFDPFKTSSIRRLRRQSASWGNRGSVEGSLADRSATWVSRREAKLAQEKEKSDRSELDGCTFVPYINQEVPDMKSSAKNAYGFDEFVNRYKMARRDREIADETRQQAFTSGEGWNGQATVPQEFQLGDVNKPQIIKSLSRPISPAHHQRRRSPTSPRGPGYFDPYEPAEMDLPQQGFLQPSLEETLESYTFPPPETLPQGHRASVSFDSRHSDTAMAQISPHRHMSDRFTVDAAPSGTFKPFDPTTSFLSKQHANVMKMVSGAGTVSSF